MNIFLATVAINRNRIGESISPNTLSVFGLYRVAPKIRPCKSTE